MAGKVIGVMSTAIPEEQKNFDAIERMPDYQKISAISLRSIKPFLSKPDKAEHLHRAKSKMWSRWFVRRVKTTASDWFITLYETGMNTIIAYVLAITVLISIVQWLYSKLKKPKYGK
jgi:hypothetical protein